MLTPTIRNYYRYLCFIIKEIISLFVSGCLSNVLTEVQTHDLDFLCLPEIWLRDADTVPDVGLSDLRLNFNSWPRVSNESSRDGGLALFYNAFFA